MNAAGFAKAVAESLTKEGVLCEVRADCVCLACRTHLVLGILQPCAECDGPICPVCGKHGQITPFGAWNVPPLLAASVRASVWGKAN